MKTEGIIDGITRLPDGEFIDLTSLYHLVKHLLIKVNQQEIEIDYLRNRVSQLDSFH